MFIHQFFAMLLQKPKRLTFVSVTVLSVLFLFCANAIQAEEERTEADGYDNRVFVPFSELDSIFGSDEKGILLSIDKFEELEKKARKNRKAVPASVKKLNITGIQYQAEIQNETIVISTEIQLQQYQEGWQSVLLPIKDLFVEEALQEKSPALLGRTEKGLHLFHQHSGEFSIKLKLIAPLTSLGSDQLASFQLIPSSNASFQFRIPVGKFLYIDGLKSSSPEIKEKEKIFTIETGGKDQLELRITDKKVDQVSDALLFASTGVNVSLNPGELNWNAKTTVQIYGQQIDQLNFTIPSSLEITEINSHGLESWNLTELEDDRLQIELKYRQAFTGTREVYLKGIQSLPPGEEWNLPNLVLNDVTSHTGRLIVSHPVSYRFQQFGGEGILLDGANGEKVKPMIQGNRLIHRYSIWNEEFEFSFKMEKKSRLPQLKVHQVMEIREKGLEMTYLGKIYPVSSAVYEFNIDIPLEWSVVSAMLDEVKLSWQVVSSEAGSQQIRFLLEQPIQPLKEKTFYLTAHHDPEDWPLEEKKAEIKLPDFKVSDVDRISGSYVIKSEEDMVVVPEGIKGMTPAVLTVEGAKLGYLFKQEPISGRIGVTRKPARVTSENLTITRLDRDSVRSHLEAKLEIKGGGVRQIDVAVSEDAGTEIRFLLRQTSARIIEQRKLKTVNNNHIWRIRFDRRLKGSPVLFLETETDRDEKTDYSPHELTIQNVERQHGYVVIEARQEQRLSIQALTQTQKPLDDVDPGNLPRSVQSGHERIVAAYHYVQPGYQIVFSEEELDRVSVPTAICHQSKYETVLNPGGESQHYARYQIVAIGVQSLLINIPEHANLWATLIDGEPVEVRKTEHGYELALTSVNPPEKKRKLELFYSTKESEIQAFGTLGQSPPLLSVIDGSGKVQSIETLKQNWSVHHPPTTMLVASTGHFVSQSKMDRSGLMSWVQDQFQTMNQWSLTNKLITLIVIVIAIVVSVKFLKKLAGYNLLYLIGGFTLVFLISLPFLLTSSRDARSVRNADFVAGAKMSGQLGQSKQAESGPDDFFLESDEAFEEAEADKDNLAGLEKSEEKNSPKDFKKAQAGKEYLGIKPSSKIAKQKKHKISKELRKRDEAGARLSVAIQFQAPQNWAQKEFQYLGTAAASSEELLKVQYEDKTQSYLYRNIAIVLVVLLCWLMRNRSKNIQMVCVLACFTFPLILMQVVPYHWYSILDGLFLGSILGLLLLMTLSSLCYLGKVVLSFQNYVSVAQIMLVSLVFFTGDSLLAKDKQVIRPNQSLIIKKKVISLNLPVTKPVPVIKEKVLVIPYGENEDPLKSDQVYLPYREYIKLWNQANPEKPLETEPPVKALVAGALYHGTISKSESSEQNSISVKGRIVFQNLTDSPVSIAIPFKPPAIRNAQLDGKPVSLQVVKVSKKIEHHVILSESGIHVLDIEFDIPAKITGQAGQFSVMINAVPSGRFSLELPKPDLNVTVKGIQPSLINHQSGEKPGISFPIDRGGNFQIYWQPKQTGGSGDSTIHVNSSTTLKLDQAGIHLSCFHSLKIRQGSLNRLEYQLPKELLIQNVEGQDVGGWKITGSGDDRKLEIFFRREVNDQTRFNVNLYQDFKVIDEEEFSLSRFGPINITHETGEIGLYSAESFAVKVLKTSGLKKLDREKFKPVAKTVISEKLDSVYRYSGSKFSLSASVVRKITKVNTKVAHGLEIKEDSIQYAHQYQLEILDSPIDHYSLSVPFGYQVKTIQSEVLEDWYLAEDEFGDNLLVISFKSPQKGIVTINITAEVPVDLTEESTALVLPFSMMESKTKTELGIWIDDSLQAILEEKEGWKQIDPRQLPADLRSLKKQPIKYAFKTSEEEISPVAFRLSRVKPLIQGSSVSIVTLTNVLMNYQYALKWKIISGSASHFSFIIPSEFQKYVEIQGSNIRQVKQSRFTPNLTRWEIFTQEPVKNEYFVMINIILPPPSSGKLKITSPVIQQYKGDSSTEFEDVNLQQHYFVLVNQSYDQLTSSGKKKSSEIDPVNIPIKVDKELTRQAIAVEQFNKPGDQTQFVYKKKRREEGLPASVNQARLTSILELDGSWRMHAVYRMKNLKRQFLAVKLPEKSRLLSAFVASKPIRPSMTTINNEKVHLIPLPKTSEVDLAFDVSLTLAGELKKEMVPDGFNLVSSELEFPAPIVISQKDDPYYGIPVARTDWTVFLPESLEVVSTENNSKMNLQNSDKELANFYRERAVLNEVKELFSILENEETSDTLRFRCWSNLEQLESEIRQQGQTSSNRYSSISGGFSSGPSKIVTENADLRKKVLSDYAINRKRIQNVDKGKQTINFNRPQRVSGLGVKQQLDYFQIQSNDIIISNSFDGVVSLSNRQGQAGGVGGNVEPTGVLKDGQEFGFKLKQPVNDKDLIENTPSPVQQSRNLSNIQQRNQALELNEELIKRNSVSFSRQGKFTNRKMRRKSREKKPVRSTTEESDGLKYSGVFGGSSVPNTNLSFGTPTERDDKNSHFFSDHVGNGIPQEGIEITGGFTNTNGMNAPVSGKAQSQSKGWTSAGGISLPIQLPKEGISYSFQKVNGAPKLMLRVRSRKTVEYGIGIFWLVAWGLIAMISFLALTGKKSIRQVSPVLLTLAGFTIFISFGNGLSILGLILFIVGGIWLAFRSLRQKNIPLAA
jgi:hypothetical protein